MDLLVWLLRDWLNRLININIRSNGNAHISIWYFCVSIQKRKTLFFQLFLAVVLLVKITPNIFGLIWHDTIFRGLVWNFLSKINLRWPLFIKIHWTSFNFIFLCVMIDFDHITLDFVLLRINDWFHAVNGVFVVERLWLRKASGDWLN